MLAHCSVRLCILPQSFYNVLCNTPLGQSLHSQQQWDEVLRDSFLSACNSGPSAPVRRSEHAEIGAWSEHALTEVVLTGIILQGRGWQVKYCGGLLKRVLVAETFPAHVEQRSGGVLVPFTMPDISFSVPVVCFCRI